MNFSRLLAKYLLSLNDADDFARRFGVKDETVRRYLRFLSSMERQSIQQRPELARRARRLSQDLRHDPETQMEVEEFAENLREEARLIRDYADSMTGLSQLSIRMRGVAAEFPEAKTLKQWGVIERKAQRALKRVLPGFPQPEQIRSVRDRLRVCPLCDRVFVRSPRNHAQRFCQTCHRRWPTKQKLWYAMKKRQQRERGRRNETTRTR